MLRLIFVHRTSLHISLLLVILMASFFFYKWPGKMCQEWEGSVWSSEWKLLTFYLLRLSCPKYCQSRVVLWFRVHSELRTYLFLQIIQAPHHKLIQVVFTRYEICIYCLFLFSNTCIYVCHDAVGLRQERILHSIFNYRVDVKKIFFLVDVTSDMIKLYF